MISGHNSIDLSDTKVPIVIPLAAIGIFAAIQLKFGTDPLIVAMCLAATATPFVPLRLFGRDLYSMIGIVFSLRYTGVALIAKTFYGQTLEENLFNPFAAYAWDLLLMIIVTAILMLARAFDRGTVAFPFPTDLKSLRRLSLVCFGISTAAQLLMAATTSREEGASLGAIGIVLNIMTEFNFLALIAEAQYAIAKSKGRTFITPVLVMMLGTLFAFVVAFNMRSVFANGLIAIVVTAFIYRMLRLRHIVAGLVVAGFFMSFLTPVTLYLRLQRTGMPISQFAELAGVTIVKAATDPSFFNLITSTNASVYTPSINSVEEYDYFGDGSNVLNRLSYIALLDAVNNSARTHLPIGMPEVDQVLTRVAPGFLGYSKESVLGGMGDWLSWQTGLGTPGNVAYLNFGLPMEGLATWGWIGFVTYPILFLLPTLLVCGRLSSLRLPGPVSIFLFTAFQHALIEDTSDGFIGLLTRGLPVTAVLLLILYKVFFQRSPQSTSDSIATSAAN